MVKNLQRRVERLLQARYARDILIQVGPGPAPALPADVDEREAVHLAEGRTFHLFAGAAAPLRRTASPDGQCLLWTLGQAAHPEVEPGHLGGWMLGVVGRGETARLAEIEGLFAAFLLDVPGNNLIAVTDVLGLRPLYLRRNGADVWLATRVGGLWDRRVFKEGFDQEALSCWTVFGYNATDRSLLAGWRRPGPATLLRIDASGVTETLYHRFDFTARTSDADETGAHLLTVVERSFLAQTRVSGPFKLALSGGFDSRLLAALSARHCPSLLRVLVAAASHDYRDGLAGESTESRLAGEICRRLGLPIEVIPVERDAFHAFGEPFLLMADGFPITKQMIDLIASHGALLPVMNGFLGDNLMRGSWDRIDGRTEAELEDKDLVGRLLRRHSQLPLFLAAEGHARELGAWAKRFVADLIAPYREASRAIVGTDLMFRQRFYMSNNFLQHLDRCDPVLPFATAALVAAKLAIPDGTLSFEGLRALLGRTFPEIGDVPHTKDVARAAPRIRLSSYTKRRWALEIAGKLARGHTLGPLDRKVLVPRLLAGTVDGRYEFVAEVAMRFAIIEALSEQLGLETPWR